MRTSISNSKRRPKSCYRKHTRKERAPNLISPWSGRRTVTLSLGYTETRRLPNTGNRGKKEKSRIHNSNNYNNNSHRIVIEIRLRILIDFKNRQDRCRIRLHRNQSKSKRSPIKLRAVSIARWEITFRASLPGSPTKKIGLGRRKGPLWRVGNPKTAMRPTREPARGRVPTGPGGFSTTFLETPIRDPRASSGFWKVPNPPRMATGRRAFWA